MIPRLPLPGSANRHEGRASRTWDRRMTIDKFLSGFVLKRLSGCRIQPSKYPSAKPEALEFWLLKAAGVVADAALESVGH